MNAEIKKRVVNVTLAIITFIIALAFAEIILRHLYPLSTATSFQFRIPHKVFGWVLQPGANYFNSMRETTVYVSYNSKGWRDTEHNFENPEEKSRIIVLGDSFMEAYSVNLEDSLPKRLEYAANGDGADVEVINLGVGGYGTLQEYLVFRDVGAKYKPDIVLLGFYLGNDIRNNSLTLESVIKPMKLRNRPFLDASDTSEWKILPVDYESALRRYKENSAALAQKSKMESKIVQLAKIAFRDARSGFYTHKHHKRKSSIADARALAMFGANYCTEQPDYTNAWNTTKRILHRLDNEISNLGGKLVVFTVPDIHEVSPEYMKDAENAISTKDTLCMEAAPSYRRLIGILRELDIEYVDLLPKFRNATTKDNINLFRKSDRHWNEIGHELAARHLYSFLVNRNLFSHIDNDAHGAAADSFYATRHSAR